MVPILIVPGRGGSAADHWQSDLESAFPDARRVLQDNWDMPELHTWAQRLDAVVRQCDRPPLVVAHSFGCLALAAAVIDHQTPVGSFLVAPADPRRFDIPDAQLLQALSPGSDLLASSNDPWLTLDRAHRLAQAWGSRLHVLGALGHINVDSGFGPWPAMRRWVSAQHIDNDTT